MTFLLAIPTPEDIERFNGYVDKYSSKPCWIWTGAPSRGYGVLRIQGINIFAHRFAYYLENGKYPDQFIDHLCNNKICVNPHHLEDVSHEENIRRGIKYHFDAICKNGHVRTPQNTTIRKNGTKLCLECTRATDKARYAQRYEKDKLLKTNNSNSKLGIDYASNPILNHQLVYEILSKYYLEKDNSYRTLSREYRVSSTMIKFIVNGKSWKQVYDKFVGDYPDFETRLN